MVLMVFFAAFSSAAAVAQEKDRRTLILLLMTRMTNLELVLGKLMASLLPVLVMLAAAVPLFCLVLLFGGVSFSQVARVFAVTLVAVMAAGSLGSTIALWREKTFQTLALTALVLFFWIGAWEAVYQLGQQPSLGGHSLSDWAAGFHPVRAAMLAAQPWAASGSGTRQVQAVGMFFGIAAAVSVWLNAWAVWRIRKWNPSRGVRMRADREEEARESIWGAEYDLAQESASAEDIRQRSADGSIGAAEDARARHVDAQLRRERATVRTRRVWDNPILWREVCTWAYGRKIILNRIAYVATAIGVAVALYAVSGSGDATESTAGLMARIPPAALVLAPFFLISLASVNALAVTSITGERDGLSLDLLLVTDVSPKEFILGKLLGVFWVAGLMIACPILLCVGLWFAGGISLENLCYVVGGLVVLDVFVAMLGIHCGMTYANSRTAQTVSQGTVFFLFLGVITCIVMIVSFSGSFQGQLAPFLAFILGGGVGLYVSLGVRNPSAAIGLASILVPFATFYAITSFILEHTLSVFLVTAAAYGFTTAAMMIPAVYEFDVEMGRTSGGQE
jgi:ABC-type Na+ efflux pump permease subunit